MPVTESQSAPSDLPSAQLGLVDGDFNVRRSNGDVETGWEVLRIKEAVDDLGEIATSAVISKDSGNGRLIIKTILRDDLLSWQEEDGKKNVKTDGPINQLADLLEKFKAEEGEDDAGNILLTVKSGHELGKVLEKFGFLEDAPTEEEVTDGIRRAKEIVEHGDAIDTLNEMPFLEKFGKLIGDMRGTRFILGSGELLYIDPSSIQGAGGLDSWAGRGSSYSGFTARKDGLGDKDYVKSDGTAVVGRSINAITDYATRGTAIPPLDFLALNIVLTNDGLVLYGATSAHRIAAAKLRDEPIAFDSMCVYDVRDKQQITESN